jgi:hypothetical protein
MRRIALTFAVAALTAAPSMWAQSEKQIDPPGSEHAKRAGELPKGKPGPGMVWVDADKKIYYRQGNKNYGKSKHGSYMSEGDAVNRGYVDRTQEPLKNPGNAQTQ